MSQVSKYPVPKDVYDRVYDVFMKTISKLKTKKQVQNFFREFLSPTEEIMLTKRLAIAFLLAKEYDYREISKVLRVSTTTISKVAANFNYGTSFKKTVNKVISDEKLEDYLLNLGEMVTSLMSAPKSKSGSWVYLRQEIEKKRAGKKVL